MFRIVKLWKSDPLIVWLAIITIGLSIASYIFRLRTGGLEAYIDGLSHLMISRRIIDSPTPGLSQLGGVWPPAPHIASLLFVWNDWMFYSGSAGSFFSMASYAVVILCIYKLIMAIGCRSWVAFIGAIIVALNPNILYMQTTSMTELPLLASMTFATYSLVRWAQSERIVWLVWLVASVWIGTATRYEAWALLGTVVVFVAIDSYRKKHSHAQLFDLIVYVGFFAGTFILGWSAWNRIIIQSGWLGFLDSEYASASLWVSENEPSLGRPLVAVMTYLYAMRHIGGLAFLICTAMGLVAFLIRDKLRLETVNVLVLAFPAPFFILMLTAGLRPLHVPEISNGAYNVRFALQMLPICGILTAYLMETIVSAVMHWIPSRTEINRQRIGLSRFGKTSAILVLAGVVGVVTAPHHTITLEEPLSAELSGQTRILQREAATWLRVHYSGEGKILMQTPGNETALFFSHILLKNVIYEGTNTEDQWNSALHSPDDWVDWIYMRRTEGFEDNVWKALNSRPDALESFRIVYETEDVRIYARNSLADQIGLPGTRQSSLERFPNLPSSVLKGIALP